MDTKKVITISYVLKILDLKLKIIRGTIYQKGITLP